MALLITHANRFGQTAAHYWRYNGLLDSANRQPDGSASVASRALFRSYDSEAAFKAGSDWMEERILPFTPSSANADMATEAYTAFKATSVPQDLANHIDRVTDAVEHQETVVSAAEAALTKAHEDAAAAGDPDTIEDLAKRLTARVAADRVAQLAAASEEAVTGLDALQRALADAAAEKATHDAWAAALTSAEAV